MEEGDDADAASRTVVFDGAGKHELRVGGQVIDVNMDDDDRDGRRLVLLAFGEQVYQLDRSRPVADLTIGPGGLTGRTVVHATSSWPRLAYWCGAAPP